VDQSRSIVIAAGAVSLAASLFAVGAAVSSDDDGGGGGSGGGGSAQAPETSEVVSPAPPDSGDVGTTLAAGATDAPAGEQVAVAIAGFQFNNGEPVTVAVGTEVVWTNEDSMDHSVEFDAASGIPTSQDLAQGDTYSFTFTEPGTYSYICGIHPRMTGTIVVEG
jgi:plastocyanin